MSVEPFNIPSSRADLLNPSLGYHVHEILPASAIIPRLQEAELSLREQGAYYILEDFNTFYSVLENTDKLNSDVVYRAYKNLQKAVDQLNNHLAVLLEDKDQITDEIRERTLTTIKMLLYIYLQTVSYLEEQRMKKSDIPSNTTSRTKTTKTAPSSAQHAVDKAAVLGALNCLLQMEIFVFWNPPVVEHEFTNMISKLCFQYLQNPLVHKEITLRNALFEIFGHFVKTYNFGETFIMLFVRMVRDHGHIIKSASEGLAFLIEQFKCKSLLRSLVEEATEWQIEETQYLDNEGSKNCATLLTELAILLPKYMLPEIEYLEQYLMCERVPLRVAILNVLTEVILKVLTRHDLSEEEKRHRDDLMNLLLLHTRDVTPAVRAKVFQNIIKLQKEMAIPLCFQLEVLKSIVRHLRDTAVVVRKVALESLATVLQYNPYTENGAEMKLSAREADLRKTRQQIEDFLAVFKDAKKAKIEELEKQWEELKSPLQEAVTEYIQKLEYADELPEDTEEDAEENEEEEEQVEEDTQMLVTTIQETLKAKQFDIAIENCLKMQKNIKQYKSLQSKLSKAKKVELFMNILEQVHKDSSKIESEIRLMAGLSDEESEKLESLETSVQILEKIVEYLTVINEALKVVKQLFTTPTISDLHAAIEFTRSAYECKIDNSLSLVLDMLSVIQYNEPERTTAVVEAFRKIYLFTHTTNLEDHTSTIIHNLISLIKEIKLTQYNSLQSIVSEWTTKGDLDNSVLQKCWNYFTGRIPLPDQDVRAVANILKMAAIGRSTIITKNVRIVATIAVSEKRRTDMQFLGDCCDLMAIAGHEKVDVMGENAPAKIPADDQIFQDVMNVLVEHFLDNVPYYSKALSAAVEFVFRVCSKPILIMDNFIKEVYRKRREAGGNFKSFVHVRLCEFLGCVASKLFVYVDDDVYKEFRRRNHIRHEREQQKKQQKTDERTSKKSKDDSGNSTVLEGAIAEDPDAEYLLAIMEKNIVNGNGLLGQFTEYLKEMCKRPHEILQHTAVTALMRYMSVSSVFCVNHMQLIFTILEKSPFTCVKCTILIHCSDLLSRFPNIVEPWCPRLFARLQDPVPEVRKSALFILSTLIMKDMIRPHKHMSEMALLLIDGSEDVRELCKSFITRLSQKENNLANVAPDIFGHLVQKEISEEDLRIIMKFIFDQMDKSKRMESLVDRFCLKFSVDESETRLNRNVAYCLSLINYNDKALLKFHDNFPNFKHHVHDQEIYGFFNFILSEASKPKTGKVDLKPICTEIENSIKAVFGTDENQLSSSDGAKRKPTKSARKKGGKGNKRKQRKMVDSDGSDDDVEVSQTQASARKRRGRN